MAAASSAESRSAAAAPAATLLACGGHRLDLSTPAVMGILNVTPDSFCDGGRYQELAAAVERARCMVAEGAAIIDVGGESTRPGAAPVPVEEELRRVIPVIERLAGSLPVPVSIDTRRPAVMRAGIAAGASMVNDVAALREPGAIEVVARSDVAVCLMHMKGEPRTMQRDPRYADVLAEVRAFLRERVATSISAGIARSRLVVDPGFGFGKTLEHNLALLRGLGEIAGDDGLPVLAGLSRKRMIGQLAARDDADRLAGSLALAIIAVQQGARILRVHDVAATVDAIRVAAAANEQRGPGP